jgi:hypothetical protein
MPSIKRRAKVTSSGSPRTFFTIWKNRRMYSSALSFYKTSDIKIRVNLLTLEIASLYCSSLMFINSLNFIEAPTGSIC